jgi:hypothetical protein
MGKHVLSVSGIGTGQVSKVTFPEDAVPTTFVAWFESISDAGIIGCSLITEETVTIKAPAAGANTDRKAVILCKENVTGTKHRIVIPAYQAAEITTYFEKRGEVIEAVSGQSIVDAWKAAAGFGALAFTFLSGRVKQTL